MTNKERLNKLLKSISEDAQKEVDQIRKKADRRVKELEQEFKEDREKYIKKQKHKMNRQGELYKKQKVTRERLEEKKKILNRKRELIDKVFEIAVKKLKDSPAGEQQKLFQKILKETVNTGTEVVKPAEKDSVVSKNFLKKVNKENNWNLELGSKIKSQEGGFLLEGENYETLVNWHNIKDYLKEKEEDNIIRSLFKGNND